MLKIPKVKNETHPRVKKYSGKYVLPDLESNLFQQ